MHGCGSVPYCFTRVVSVAYLVGASIIVRCLACANFPVVLSALVLNSLELRTQRNTTIRFEPQRPLDGRRVSFS